MLCSISGNPTTEPVLSPVSGHIFDRTLIENYIEQNGKDPINDQPLAVQDLIVVNSVSNINSTPTTITSIPNLLSQFQREWDALAIELFTLRKQLKESREELSILLYHHDAAVRVAARAVSERDEAKKALENMASSLARGNYDDIVPDAIKDEEVADDGEDVQNSQNDLSDEIVSQIKEAHTQLFGIHKAQKKKPHYDVTSKLQFSVSDTVDYQPVLDKITGFKTASITSIIPNPNDSKSLLITFNNSHALMLNSETHEVVSKLTIKKKKLVSSVWCNDVPVLGFEDGSIAIEDRIIKSASKLGQILAHPVLPLIISVHKSSFQIFYEEVCVFKSGTLPYSISSLDLHGDGILLALGCEDGSIHIYDISAGQQVSKMNNEGAGEVRSLVFASNGYWLVSAFSKDTIKIFDLRKETGLAVFELEGVHFLDIDYSSNLIYLLNTSEETIGLSYLKYVKKQKNWIKADVEDLEIDKVSKLKKNVSTEVVGTYKENELLVIVENSNKITSIDIVSA